MKPNRKYSPRQIKEATKGFSNRSPSRLRNQINRKESVDEKNSHEALSGSDSPKEKIDVVSPEDYFDKRIEELEKMRNEDFVKGDWIIYDFAIDELKKAKIVYVSLLAKKDHITSYNQGYAEGSRDMEKILDKFIAELKGLSRKIPHVMGDWVNLNVIMEEAEKFRGKK